LEDVFSSIAARGGPRVRISWVADVENSKAALRMIGETSDSLTVEEASGWCVLVGRHRLRVDFAA
jgi:hypothetical protein